MDMRPKVRRWIRASARRRMLVGLLGLMLGTALLGACGPIGGTQAEDEQAGTKAPPKPARDSGTILEVRASGSSGGPGEETLAADAVDKLRRVAGVAEVEAFLFGEAQDGTVVVGMDPLEAELRTPAGRPLDAEILGGRRWVKGDEAKPVAYAGKAYAGTHETQFDAIISEMISPTHSPLVDLGDDNVVDVRAVVETGSPHGNAQVYVPLAFAQGMFGEPGRVSKVYATVESPDKREAVAREIRAALGDGVEVAAVP